MLLLDAIKVKGVVIISSPGLIPVASKARCSAVVPFDVTIVYLEPINSPNLFSKSLATGPSARYFESITAFNASFSSFPTWGSYIV